MGLRSEFQAGIRAESKLMMTHTNKAVINTTGVNSISPVIVMLLS